MSDNHAFRTTAEWGTTQFLTEVLEELTDDYGLELLVNRLASVCFAKANHLATNWSDYKGQVEWDRYGDHLCMLSYDLFTRHDNYTGV